MFKLAPELHLIFKGAVQKISWVFNR